MLQPVVSGHPISRLFLDGWLLSADEKSPGGGLQPNSVLIVEDDYLVGCDIEDALRFAGLNVIGIATTADEAIQFALSERPQLVIMDIRLRSGRDGVDAAVEIFRSAGIRSLFASAHADAATMARASAASPLGWLAKPYSMPALVAAVRAALDAQKN